MIGERLESHGNLPWGALLFLAVGAGLVAAGLTWGINGMVVGAVLPLAMGGSLWLLGQERPFTATLREEGLEIEDAEGPTLIPYASIQNIKVGGRLADPAKFDNASSAIVVQHEGGQFRIPSRLNLPSHEVFRFLAAQVPDCGRRDVNPALADYLARQEQYFGPASVGTYRAASRRASGTRLGYRAFLLGLMIGGAAWSAFGFSGFGEIIWAGVGIACLVVGAFLFAASFAEVARVSPVKDWKKASLVIGPQGLAMVQGDIQGEVHWPELLEIRFNARPRGFNLGNTAAMAPGILLRVKGASILIADIYDRPLFVIYNRILDLSGRSPFLEREL